MNNIVDALVSNDKFFLATHLNPDGDAIGSAVALALALKSMGKDVTVYDLDGVPSTCSFLPGSDMVVTSIRPEDIDGAMLVILDCNDSVRAGLKDVKFERSMVIDHHKTESAFGDIKWVDPKEPATGAMIFKLLKAMGLEVTSDIAINLYAAIAIDTGTFRYGNTSAEVLDIAAELVRAGARPAIISDRLYNSWTPERYRLFSLVQGEVRIEGAIALSHVSRSMYNESGATSEDTENFVNFPMLMDNVKVSVLFKENEGNLWKMSLRSKDDIDVSQVAEKFNGGGHKNAAGCKLEGNFNMVVNTIKEAIEKII
jgi:phosphoesterase RecJ-like protein